MDRYHQNSKNDIFPKKKKKKGNSIITRKLNSLEYFDIFN